VELRQLKHFLVVAEEHHFTRAAQRLNIVQSGLSASIQALEEDLGAALFVRTTRRVELTDAGRTLLVEARRALAAADAARDAVASVQGLTRGTLTIGLMQGLPASVALPETLGRFHRQYPGVAIRLVQAGSEQLLESVRSGSLDLAFPAVAGPLPPGIVTRPLAESALVLACSASHRLAARHHVTLEDLRDEDFVEFQHDWTASLLADRAFAEARITRRRAFEVNDLFTLTDLVAHGLGVAVVPHAVAADDGRLRCIPLRPAAPTWKVVVATAGETPGSVAARALLAMVLDTGTGSAVPHRVPAGPAPRHRVRPPRVGTRRARRTETG
jgi:DNA-binding transcriptional LysR family regulator